jgi:NAD(P)-dependent dehydrogenase (short-subunit alcohol dehydrogenase family)
MIGNPFSLEGKTILITGASSGIGRAVAIECSKLGAVLLITGRNAERLNDTFIQLEGQNHTQIIADLLIEEQTDKLVAALPVLDGVVHCAGIITTLPFQFITKAKLDEIFSINFITPTLMSQQIVKRNKIKKGGSFVWISSVSGTLCTSPGSSMYSATKSAINGIVKGMALELASKGVRVNSVNPGVVETNLFSEGVIAEDQIRDEIKKYPLKRFGKPEEIAYAVIYLLSDASAWVTGSNLIIDGGYTLL